MADFAKAIEVVFQHEGGVSDHKDDRGGHTRYGVTWPFFREAYPHATEDDFRALTYQGAELAYKRVLWDRWRLEQVHNQAVATKLLDVMVNLGARTGIRLAQMALSLVGYPTTPDGLLGLFTLRSLNAAVPRLLIGEMKRLQRKHYERIVADDPKQKVFLKGWLKRAAWPEEVA